MAHPTKTGERSGEPQPVPEGHCPFCGDLLPHRCPSCHDMGWVKRWVGPLAWQHEAVRCACQQSEDSKRRWERARRMSDLARPLYSRTFANFDTGRHGDAHYALGLWSAGPARWVALWGPPGTGKTHLLAATFNALVDRGECPLYVIAPALLEHIRAGIETGEYSERFMAIRATPILLLDDLGAERRTAWSDEALFILLDHRYRNELPTVIASNCKPGDLEPRIASRLQDRALVQAFTMGGSDYRRTAARARQAEGIQAIHAAVAREQTEVASAPADDAAAEQH